jgi:hypothetical protein
LLSLGIFFLLALSAQRAIVWWGMTTPVVLAALLPAPAAEDVTVERRRRRRRRPRSRSSAPCSRGSWFWRPGGGSAYDRFLGAAPGLTAAAASELPAGTEPGSPTVGSWFEYALPDLPCSWILGSRSSRRTSGTTTARSDSQAPNGRTCSTAGTSRRSSPPRLGPGPGAAAGRFRLASRVRG